MLDLNIFDDRIEFQNPGRILFPLEELRERLHSVPRNPSIIRLLRHAKLGENAGYGIQRMVRWESLTGKPVMWESDLMSTTVTYYRPLVGEHNNSTTPKTTPKDNVRNKILRYIRVTPDISKKKLAELCGLTVDGITYHISKLKADGYIRWEGKPRNGRWNLLK